MVEREGGEVDSQPEILRSRVTAVLQPIGVDQGQRRIRGGGEHRPEERLVFAHAVPPDLDLDRGATLERPAYQPTRREQVVAAKACGKKAAPQPYSGSSVGVPPAVGPHPRR